MAIGAIEPIASNDLVRAPASDEERWFFMSGFQ
jgi:hypothetical protein